MTEDRAFGDATCALLPPLAAKSGAIAVMTARETGVVCGLGVAAEVFRAMSRRVRVEILVPDGKKVARGAALLKARGPLSALLAAERTALNFAGRLSGIATLTARFVDAVRGTRARIFDTRKTTPCLRELEKSAVRAGGGRNHRMNLADMILVKDNHLAVIPDPVLWVKAARRRRKQIEIECDSITRLPAVAVASPDIILLDNMSPQVLRRAISYLRKYCPSAQIEVSGGVNIKTVRGIARLGPDRISVGALTHSAPSLDLSLEIKS